MRFRILLLKFLDIDLGSIQRKCVLLLFFCGIVSQIMAQKTVTGVVYDETGEPLPGVNVIIKNTSIGTTTNVNGTYTIEISDDNGDVLLFSSIGYETQEITIGNQSEINVSMNSSIEQLNEIVVVGYGSQKKSDLTGAVASVNLESLEEAPNTNIGQYLQGTIPGLNVGVSTTAGGTPPISIRGRVSLNGNQNVLIILDGIQYTGSLSSINPNDIASIDVLKDASSTAVYGAQAANGVILITSKKGRVSEKPRINFNSAYTLQEPTVTDFIPQNREQYLAGLREAFYDQAYTEESGYTEPNPSFNLADVIDATMRDTNGELLPNDFSWWDEGTNPGSIFENNLSISGSTEKVTYLLSGSSVDQSGFIINDKFKRKTLRANLEVKALDWWKVGVVSSASFVNQDGAEPALGTLQHASPLHVPYDENGDLIISPTNTLELNAFLTYDVEDFERHNYYFANVYTELDFPFIKGLSYRLNFGNNARVDRRYFASQYDAGQTGRAFKDDRHYYDYTFDNILTYKKAFSDHDFGVTLLYGSIERKYRSTFADGTGFSRLNLSYNDLSLAATQLVSSDAWDEALNYQMARLNYKYADRYLVTATIRRDGFSGFAKNNKYGLFPTLAVAWVLSEESFMQNMESVDQFKIRVGYGEIGNQTSRYSSLARLITTPVAYENDNRHSTAYIYGDGGNTAFGQRVISLGNPDLKWERTKGFNFGIDFSLFNFKTTGTLDFYNNSTVDLLYNVAIPSITGFGEITTNLGEIKNSGFEASINQVIMEGRGVNWNATLNFSTNKNRIVTLTGQDADEDGVEDDLISSGLFIGKSIDAVYHYETDGVYGLNDTRLPGFPVGSMSVVDQDGDGDITPDNDRVFLGREEPAYRVSLQNSISYKGVMLSFLINSVQGGKNGYLGVNRPFANNTPQYYREDNTIRWNDFVGLDYWSPNNPDGKYPRNISGSRAKVEPAMYQKRNFIRLQDISLSYNLKNSLLKNVNAEMINVYISGKNILTWTNWEGWDPETVDNDGNPVGLTIGGRPLMKAVTLGLNVTF